MAEPKWLEEIEHRCFPSGEIERMMGNCETPALPPTKTQMRQLIAAVRLSERVVDEEIRRCRTVCSFEQLNDLRSRLRSGSIVESK